MCSLISFPFSVRVASLQSIEIAARWVEKLEAAARATAERSALRKANARAEAAALRAQQQQQIQQLYQQQQLHQQQLLSQSQGGGLAPMSPAAALGPGGPYPPSQFAAQPPPSFTTQQQQALLEQQHQKRLLKQQRRALKANAAAVERAEYERVRVRVMADPVVAEAVRVYGLTNDASKLGASGLLKMAELVKEKQAEMMAIRAREIEKQQQEQQQLGSIAAASSDHALQPAPVIGDVTMHAEAVPLQQATAAAISDANMADLDQGRPLQEQLPHGGQEELSHHAGVSNSHPHADGVPAQASAVDGMHVDQSAPTIEAS
jgi:hypothetical protein